jgi:hypothetical protein
MRFHAGLAIMRFLDGISCFLAAEFSFRWCDVRTVETWMLIGGFGWGFGVGGDDGMVKMVERWR